MVRDRNWHGILLRYCGVIASVGFNLECYRRVVVGCSRSVDGVGAASQFDGLGNGANGCLDATGFDLSSASKHSFPDPSSKSLDDHDLFWDIQVLKVVIDTGGKERSPVPPVTFPCRLSRLHDSSFGVVVDSSEKIRPSVFVGNVKAIHKPFCGRGKREWNSVRNFFVSGNCVNDREAKSAMRLDLPAI